MTLSELATMGIEIRLDGDNLVAKGAITDSLVEVLRSQREILIAELRGRTCTRCFNWWRIDQTAGDCLKHHFKTLPADDCGAWRPWQGHALREINS